ncbi:hypothetical protein KPL33_01025 [Clostridium algidicarnis]|uniref:hypothetical protein n=1 Tax=Clostridium algidicarnis TaxID=37659 RepID=UPI001C0C4B69|nr:hypothetical protein [Clostridium algidicarnis]MBU3205560.1 hypothetical protein [Clostridium algidicarnis]
MDKYIEKIYKMLKSPIVTPYNLLENSRLDNYEYVKYSKGPDGLICQMKCLTDDIETVFVYYFDEQDFLQKIMMQQNGNERCMFERTREIEELKEQFTSIYNGKRSYV